MDKQYTRETLLTTASELQRKLDRRKSLHYRRATGGRLCQGSYSRRDSLRFVWPELDRHQRSAAQGFHVHDPSRARTARRQRVERSRVSTKITPACARRGDYGFSEYYGHPNVQMLDGGFQRWKAAGAPVTTDATPPKAATFKIAERRDVLATTDDVLARSIRSTSPSSTRAATANICGTHVRAARGGAIPGAIHIEWTDNIAPDGKFKSNDELKDDVRQSRHHAGQRSVLLLPGRLSRGA